MIATIAKHESMSVIRSLQSWVIAALLSLLFGFLFLRQLEAFITCLLYTSPSPRDRTRSRMPSSA